MSTKKVKELSEEAKAVRREYYKNIRANRTEEQKEKEREYAREWRSKNRQKIRDYERKYWEERAKGVI